MKTFKCTFITPQGSLFEGEAQAVVAPGVEGQFAVLAGHMHIVAVLKAGLVKIKFETTQHFFVIDSGVLEVDGNHDVIILADKALKSTGTDIQEKLMELASTAP